MKKIDSIKELLAFAYDYLGNGCKNTASLDAEVLLAHVLGVRREHLMINSEEAVDDALIDLYKGYLKRVKAGEPLAYITHEKEFYGLDFFVDSRVLVPRPETELLVDKALDYLGKGIDGRSKAKILDVGTGSCNIPVAIVMEALERFPGLFVDIDAVDISEEALDVARINVEQHGLEDRIRVFQSDLLNSIDNGESYDIIVANLPYIGEKKNRFVSGNVEKYEPNVALFGGDDGLGLYKKMFQEMIDNQLRYGVVIGEFGFAQREGMSELLSKYFDQDWRIEDDLAGIERLFIIKQ